MLLFSDGISSSVDFVAYADVQDLQSLAKKILAEHGKEHDDVTVVLLRCGEP